MTATPPPPSEPLTSVYTSNLPGILAHYGISLAVSTYQAGKVILVRADNGAGGATINTHFRGFNKPMGIAGDGSRLTVGGVNTVWTYRNMPAVAHKLEPVGKHDACYLPRRIHVTGDIDIHELNYAADGELWVINTRFCCLCTLDAEHSFTPRWRPHFVSQLAPEDRCHLNGLAMVDGQPRYVTALGETDTAGGWRANKRSGGLLMDVPSNRILLRGLSMPHSPRLYAGRLWLLESGQGSLAWADLPNGTWHTVATLPGFTRGISFIDRLAFIGLSQVRETATFSGIPLVERLTERTCGVWVVNIQTGETVAFLRFDSGVREIFAVQALPARFPELLEFGDERINHSYVIPDAALAETPDGGRQFSVVSQKSSVVSQQTSTVSGPPSAVGVQPSAFESTFNRGVAALEQDRFAEAHADLQMASEMQPGRAEVWNNLGNVYFRQARMREAIPCYERAIGLNPKQADAHMNLGMALLTLGDLRRGFAEFDWRWQTNQFTPFLCPQPRWDGAPAASIGGGATPDRPPTILIHTEQGAGDSIQCARFIPQVAALGWRVLLAAPESLRRLLRTVEGVAEVIGAGDIPVNAFDVYAPLMSLPGILGTTLETLPAATPYLRAPDDDRPQTDDGRRTTDDRRPPADHRLSSIVHRPLRVGIAWAGSPTQGNDRNRSAALADFAPLLDVPGIEWYSLQVGEKARELADAQAAERAGQPVAVDGRWSAVKDMRPQLHDWADTAALIDQLDLVISVDTGIVHLAGALGAPVWVLLCYAPDWRWLLDRDDSPWYPSARLFRQRRAKDWAPVMAEVADTLAKLRETSNVKRQT